MGQKTRRWGMLKRITREELQKMSFGQEFTAMEMVEKVKPRFEDEIRIQTMGACLSQLKQSESLDNYRRNKNEPYIWVLGVEVEAE